MSAKGVGDDKPCCPRCGYRAVWRNGETSAGKQQYRCRKCNRVFVLEPYLDKLVVVFADRMLEQGLPVPTVVYIMKGFVSRRWLYNRREVLRGRA